MIISDEQLAAFADGELEGAEHKAVTEAVQADAALAAKVAQHRTLRETLGAHFAPVAEAALPDRLTDMLATPQADNVVPFAPGKAKVAKPAIRRWGWLVGPALAASLVLAIFLPRMGGGAGDSIDPALAQALDGQLVANQSATAETRILLSFRRKGGDYCRAFTGADQSGIACREDGGWKLIERAGGDAPQGSDYRQAGSGDLLALAQDMAVGGALDAAAEQQAQAVGWHN